MANKPNYHCYYYYIIILLSLLLLLSSSSLLFLSLSLLLSSSFLLLLLLLLLLTFNQSRCVFQQYVWRQKGMSCSGNTCRVCRCSNYFAKCYHSKPHPRNHATEHGKVRQSDKIQRLIHAVNEEHNKNDYATPSISLS